ncbi:MAG: alpha/beta hydrolase family protein, partial [Planctomycetota bacterium]
ESGQPRLYPLTPQQALDETTLDPVILADRTAPSVTHPDRQVRWVTVRFFSHEWKDGPWHATMTVAMPPKIKRPCLGLAAITLAGVGKKGMEPDFDAVRDLAETTAMEFGIPVATMPQQGTHFGLTEIHELSDHLTRRFVETGDPSWLAAYPGAAVRARAVTMIGKLAGQPIHSVVHMGGSITAGQGWVWAAFDDRVKGLVASGSIGPFTKIYPDRPPRQRLRFLHEASAEIKDLFAKHRDPINYAPRIACHVLIATGSNDPASPPAVMPEFAAAFKGPASLATVPNGLHSPGTQRQAETFRMWIDHTLFGRPLSGLSIEELSCHAGKITCRATVTGRPTVKAVNLLFTRTDNPEFLATAHTVPRRKDNYTQARWQTTPMHRDGKTWTVTLAVPNPKPKYIACFVDVRDELKGRPGHITSLIRQLPTPGK